MMSPFFMRPPMPPQMMFPQQFTQAPFFRAPSFLPNAISNTIPSAIPNSIPGAIPSAIPNALPAATGGFQTFLTNANALMANADKITPYVQQFQPMVKNLPALWRLYKSFKGEPTTSNVPSSNFEEPIGPSPEPVQENRRQPSPPRTVATPIVTRPSTPKIYQPTWP